MKDSSDIRKLNINLIRRLLYSNKEYSKQDISLKTGLSLSTCNTLLNELAANNEIIGEKKQLQNIGPRTMVYHVNTQNEQLLCISFEITKGLKTLILNVLSFAGNILEEHIQTYDYLDYDLIKKESMTILAQWPNISQVIISGCCVPDHGIIRICDIEELENVAIVNKLSTAFSCPVHLENDMHLKSYGYYIKSKDSKKILTLANFPSKALPGISTIYNGTLIRGSHLFAGNIGYLPFELSPRELLLLLGDKKTARPIISRVIIAIISMIDPSSIVLTGQLVEASDLAVIRSDCMKTIPERYLPELHYADDLYKYMMVGMHQKALDIKLSMDEEYFF
ncbi:ROK family protein [Lactonifactor sp. BIOML-A3]|uniref:ROK family protein n=1 Tax=unclassified Lactonifactor TaxID=2636670 RepID=UPI0012AF020E|nr:MULTISPECIES: ROK family protein [unclassified Lactonifactor]MSA01602.1 ROK family protein [Lactonifactor sp. BIOML-A5]MSA07842.1 ROK family protein [Lactonifactor sp. BIOML-A4]MSA12459.1 ROK family protein [Lactonifactor sp. BIOML-A3]MSA17492.1 ROK family protein [Lactonifactor sp. BIOML-A2]MSA38033.1 ROK family protein [Lactonifactor sp. BIOML-A1]